MDFSGRACGAGEGVFKEEGGLSVFNALGVQRRMKMQKREQNRDTSSVRGRWGMGARV